jgi:hypothetical protein
MIKKETEPVKTLPDQTPATSPVLVYSLTAVKVNIRTGSDNKEFPSMVQTSLGVRGGRVYKFFRQDNLKMK